MASMPLRLFGLAVICAGAGACDVNTRSSPTAPAVQIEFSLAGRVSSESIGLASSSVEIVSGTNAGLSTTTDVEGRYQFARLTAGQFVLRASAAGYESQTSNVILDEDTTANFVLPRASAATRISIAGVVVDAMTSQPIASAQVSALPPEPNVLAAATGPDGRYALEVLAADAITLEAVAPGYERQAAEIRPSETRTADFRLRPAGTPAPLRVSLFGVVTADGWDGAAAAPIAGARIAITAGPQSGRNATTDHTGRYQLDGLFPEPLTVEVSAPGYATQVRPLTPDAGQPADFALVLAADAIALRGRTVDGLSGAGIAGVTITGDGVSSASTGPDGRFVLTASGGSPGARRLELTGTGVVTRRTYVAAPAADILVSLIPMGFDRHAFDEMLRQPMLRRWESAPPLVIHQRAVAFTDVNMSEAAAAAALMTGAELETLVGDLTWALPQLTGGTFDSFASVATQTAEPGSTVTLLNAGVITVVRVVGLASATGAWGWSRWLYGTNGVVVGGLIMLDEEFERSDSTFRRSLHAHELGHALGYAHVATTPSVMNPHGRLEPTPFDLDATRIAFARPPGNRAPDDDPKPVAEVRRTGGAAWSAAMP
jgi:hypothetical protein